MVHLLFIHKDQRVAVLVAQLRALSPVPITAVNEFDQGVQHVFDMQPTLIFMQEEINGESCLLFVGHIKRMLRENAPKIVLLRDEPARELLAEQGYFTSSIDLTAFGEDLLTQVRQVLDQLPGMVWNKDSAQAATDKTVSSFTAEPAATADASERLLPLDTDESLSGPLATTLQSVPATGGTVDLPVVAAKSKLDDFIADEFKAYEEIRRRRQKRRNRLLLLGGGLVTAMVLICWLVYQGQTGSPKPDPVPLATGMAKSAGMPPAPIQPKPGAAAPTVGAKLPALLESAVTDAGYAQRKPGWERRVAPGFELLLFREQKVLRAVQVVARGRDGLAAQVVGETMQLAGGTTVAWRQVEIKDGIRVEQAVLPNRAEVLRYSRLGTKAPVALVVALP